MLFSHPDSPCWQFGMGSGSKASFTPFVDPRVYQTSPTEDDEDNLTSGDLSTPYNPCSLK